MAIYSDFVQGPSTLMHTQLWIEVDQEETGQSINGCQGDIATGIDLDKPIVSACLDVNPVIQVDSYFLLLDQGEMGHFINGCQ